MDKTNQNNSLEAKKDKVRELLEMGKAKGSLTMKEIMDQLIDVELDPDQFDKLLESMEALGIEVVS